MLTAAKRGSSLQTQHIKDVGGRRVVSSKKSFNPPTLGWGERYSFTRCLMDGLNVEMNSGPEKLGEISKKSRSKEDVHKHEEKKALSHKYAGKVLTCIFPLTMPVPRQLLWITLIIRQGTEPAGFWSGPLRLLLYCVQPNLYCLS